MLVHVECIPDETLLKKLGFVRKQIRHHNGKPLVFGYIRKKTNQVAMVDEDPDSPKHPYEFTFSLQKEKCGIKYFLDRERNNHVLVLKGKLENWIIESCRTDNIDPRKYNLPIKPNDLHEVINNRLKNFENLLSTLIESNNEAILTLKKWLYEAN